MPTRNDIFRQIIETKRAAQDTIRRRYLKSLQKYSDRDTLIYASAFSTKKLPQLPSYLVSITSEDIQGFMSALHGLKRKKLDLILHSPGGSLEAADQIVQYLRAKYDHIRAIIPQNAMSAATMIACACDEIIMGKHSAIGPIDPQITFPTENGHFTAPAQSILDEFERAKAEVIADPRSAALWVNKMKNYPPGFLNMCKNTIALSVDKVTEWLSNYMFLGENDAEQKAKIIAEWLGKTNEHKTHGRPINYYTAAQKGLKIVELESDQEFQEKVLSVYHATIATLEISNCMKFIENHNGKGFFLNIDIKAKIN